MPPAEKRTGSYLLLVCYKSLADLLAEIVGSRLGVLWLVLEPFAQLSVFYVVFGQILGRGGDGFVPFLLCGLVAWRWFGTSVSACTTSISRNAPLLSQAYLPKILLPVSSILVNTCKHLVELLVLITFLLAFGSQITLAWLALPLVFACQALLIFGCGALLAGIEPFVSDLRKIVANCLTFLFFLSGVFFDTADFTPTAQFYFDLNPVARLLQAHRAILIHGEWPSAGGLLYVVVVGSLLSWLAVAVLRRFDRHYPKLVMR